jgi:glycogen debranching enzyme
MQKTRNTRSTFLALADPRVNQKFLKFRIAASLLVLLISLSTPNPDPQAAAAETKKTLELTRPVRTWEFLCSVGQRAGIFGNEAGRVEAWVYPLKLSRDFSLVFHTPGRDWNAADLVRTVIVRPESTTLTYVGDTFRVEETFLVPVGEPGAVIKFDIETEQPLEIEASFVRDFQLEWPAALGATFSSWDPPLHAFAFGEEQKRYAALVGSPTGILTAEEYETNFANSSRSSFRLGTTNKGKDTKLIVISASVNGAKEAAKTYAKLADRAAELEKESAAYYADYLQRTVQLDLPDADLQQAYDWSRISILQGLVTNPFLGKGLVAGYRTSGATARPGFAWFFGRDSLWTSFGLNSVGDFATTRDALKFLIQFQREDGKIPHEIAQTASLVNWFKDYPYGFASADATPLFIIAIEDYVRASGDASFAKDNWASLWKAYQFLQSTRDELGYAQNFGVGHGWVEGGPLLPIKTELYQSALGLEALHSLSELAKVAGKEAEAQSLAADFEKYKSMLDAFWSPEKKTYSFALDQNAKRVEEASVLATVPMWFGLLDDAKARDTIGQLASLDHATDWGVRIISNHSLLFSAGGYHFGSVWPLFTGWASVGEYHYHQAHPALQALRANALLALDGSPGHVTEVLSGTFYQGLSTSSPHQIWSAAMVVSPMLRGMFGLRADAFSHTITLAPTLPADWNSFSIRNLRAGDASLDATFHRSATEMQLEIKRSGTGECFLEFQPALSLRAEVLSVELNGRPLPFRLEKNETDQHLITRFAVFASPAALRVRLRNDFGIAHASSLPPLGQTSQGLRILSESWSASRDSLTLDLEGVPGSSYNLSYFRGEELTSLEGGMLSKTNAAEGHISVVFQQENSGDVAKTKLILHFAKKSGSNKKSP